MRTIGWAARTGLGGILLLFFLAAAALTSEPANSASCPAGMQPGPNGTCIRLNAPSGSVPGVACPQGQTFNPQLGCVCLPGLVKNAQGKCGPLIKTCPPNQVINQGVCVCKPGYVKNPAGVCVCLPGVAAAGAACK